MLSIIFAVAPTGLVVGPAMPATRTAIAPAAQPTMMVKTRPPDKNVWVSFAKASDCKPGEIISGFQYGQEIALACAGSGALYALSNKLPLTGTAFSLKTGKVSGDWCPNALGKLIFGRLIPPQDVPTFKVRKQGNVVQVLINVNAKAQFEFSYWRGVLDSQGKVDGGYY